MTVIIDYGVGNIGSIANMLKRLDEPSVISADPKEIGKADRLVLCGIGAFDDGMRRLEEAGITELVKQKALEDKTPILGICLGMQMFTEGSEEGDKPGLGLVKGRTKKFRFENIVTEKPLRIPHMGWNAVQSSKDSNLLQDMYADPRFYFVHSYYVEVDDPKDELLKASYGLPFTAAFEKDNIIGVQFHPEKSHKYGMRLFKNFVTKY